MNKTDYANIEIAKYGDFFWVFDMLGNVRKKAFTREEVIRTAVNLINDSFDEAEANQATN